MFIAYLATSLIPAQLLLVPRFVYFEKLGLYDTLWALILPGMFTVLGTFLMRQYFVSQPDEFAEAARLDGANELQIFFRIYLPNAHVDDQRTGDPHVRLVLERLRDPAGVPLHPGELHACPWG